MNIFPPTGDLSMGGYKLTDLGTPTAGTDATNKAYVDAFVSGLTPLAACVVATTGALTATYANGASGVGATLTNATTQAAITIDGVALSSSQRVLVKDQPAGAQDGLYTVTTVGSGATNWVLTRATDFDTSAEMIEGSYTNITSGTSSNKGSIWLFTTSQPITVGTTVLTFSEFGMFVTSVFGRAGAVTAQTGDYTAAQITGLGTIVNEEIPTGTINGSNVTFTLANTPLAGSLALYLAGARQWNNGSGDYTLSGATITFANAPTVGALLADYRY